jgi:hypothetical protein
MLLARGGLIRALGVSWIRQPYNLNEDEKRICPKVEFFPKAIHSNLPAKLG